MTNDVTFLFGNSKILAMKYNKDIGTIILFLTAELMCFMSFSFVKYVKIEVL